MGMLSKEFGAIPLRRFTTRLVEEYQSRMLTAGRKAATANRHLATLKHAITKAVEWEMVEEETLKRVSIPHSERRHCPGPGALRAQL